MINEIIPNNGTFVNGIIEQSPLEQKLLDVASYIGLSESETQAYINSQIEAMRELVATDPPPNPFEQWKPYIFDCLTADEDIPPVTHLVEDFIIEGNIFLLYGRSGSNKTNFLLDALYHVASGKPFLNKETTQRNVLWVEYDTGENPMRNRVASFNRYYGFNPSIDQFGVIAKHVLGAMVDLSNVENVIQLGMWLQTTGYQVLVLDAFINVSGATDMNSPEMRHVMNNLRLLLDYIPTVCVIAHTNKGHKELANSQNIYNQSDDVWRIESEMSDGKKTHRVVLTMAKARTTEMFEDVGAEFHYEKFANEDGTVSNQTRLMWFNFVSSNEVKKDIGFYSLERAMSHYEAGHKSQRALAKAMLGKSNVPHKFRKFYNEILLPQLNSDAP